MTLIVFAFALQSTYAMEDVDQQEYLDTMLLYHIHQGNLGTVKSLLEQKADPNTTFVKDHAGSNILYSTKSTALLEAIRNNEPKICELLIQYGANVNLADRDTQKPFREAICKQNKEICVLLLEHKAKVNNEIGEPGISPLRIAINYPSFGIVKLIVEHNANIHEITFGQTALHVIAHNAKINKEDREEHPTLPPSKSKPEKLLRFLIAQGADKNTRDANGKTAYDYCPEYDFLKPDDMN